MARNRIDRTGWRDYLADFHARFPGITEEILGATRSGGVSPYQWILDAVPSESNVLDLACGSAPMLTAGWRGPWVGIDRSKTEVDAAARYRDHRIVEADAHDLPFDDAIFDVVVCSMALMLLDPLRDCLSEVSRVLVADGIMVVLIPAGSKPLTSRDVWRWSHLLFTLRRGRLTYPNDREIRRLGHTLSVTGFSVVSDQRCRFPFTFSDTAAARRFVDSLYLPRIPPRRIERAHDLVSAWVGSDIGIPLRRIVIQKHP
jgi:SAM-dependent methyltransferase